MSAGAPWSIAPVFGLLLALLVAPAHADEASGTMELPKWWTATGDLEHIVKRRVVRILVPFSKTQFFADKTQFFGSTVETGRSSKRS
jgi:hypothetical protein